MTETPRTCWSAEEDAVLLDVVPTLQRVEIRDLSLWQAVAGAVSARTGIPRSTQAVNARWHRLTDPIEPEPAAEPDHVAAPGLVEALSALRQEVAEIRHDVAELLREWRGMGR